MKKAPFITKNNTLQTNKILLFSVFTTLGFLASCTPKPAVVAVTKTNKVENLALGKTIFDNSCGKCHDLPNPTDHSAQDWVGIMNRMAPKSKLNDDQHAMVYDYIVSIKK
jgi:cytochrome c5